MASEPKETENEWSIDDFLTQSGDDRSLETSHVLIYGPEDVGKTTAILSFSKDYHSVPKSKTKTLKAINDHMHVSFDNNALAPARGRGVNIVNELNVPMLMRPPRKGEKRPYLPNIEDVLEIMVDVVVETVVNKGIASCGFDTLSLLGQLLQTRAEVLEKQGAFNTKNGKINEWAKQDFVAGNFRKVQALAMSLPCVIFFGCHGRAKSTPTDAVQAAQKRKDETARAGPGDHDFFPDIMGGKQISNLFTGNCQGVWNMTATGKDPKNLTRTIHTTGGDGWMAKNKWRDILEPEEPANIRAIWTKLEKAGA